MKSKKHSLKDRVNSFMESYDFLELFKLIPAAKGLILKLKTIFNSFIEIILKSKIIPANQKVLLKHSNHINKKITIKYNKNIVLIEIKYIKHSNNSAQLSKKLISIKKIT